MKTKEKKCLRIVNEKDGSHHLEVNNKLAMVSDDAVKNCDKSSATCVYPLRSRKVHTRATDNEDSIPICWCKLSVIFLFAMFIPFAMLNGLHVIKVDCPQDTTYSGVEGLEQAISIALYEAPDSDICIELYGEEYYFINPIQIHMSATPTNDIYSVISNLTIKSAYGPENCLIWACPEDSSGINGRCFAVTSNNNAVEKKLRFEGLSFRYDGQTNAIIYHTGKICNIEVENCVFNSFSGVYKYPGGNVTGVPKVRFRNNTIIRHFDETHPPVIAWYSIDISTSSHVDIEIENNDFECALLPIKLNSRFRNVNISNNTFTSPYAYLPDCQSDNKIAIHFVPDYGFLEPATVYIANNILHNVLLDTININAIVENNKFSISSTGQLSENIVTLSNWNITNHNIVTNSSINNNIIYASPNSFVNCSAVLLDYYSDNSQMNVSLSQNSFFNIDPVLNIDRYEFATFTYPVVKNNIFYGSIESVLLNGQNLDPPLLISNSLFELGFPSDTINFQIDSNSCFMGDPLIDFDEQDLTYSLIWTTESKSPCINAGFAGENNEFTDPDGTPPDIGAIYYPHYHKEYTFEPTPLLGSIFWTCFPVLDDRSVTEDVRWNELGYLFQEHIENAPLYNQLDLIQWSYAEEGAGKMYWFDEEWHFIDYPATQPKGFKVKFNEDVPAISSVVVNGFRADPAITPIELQTVDQQGVNYENWIGYFVHYTQYAGKAFEKLISAGSRETCLDYLLEIKTQSWSTRRNGQDWIIDPDRYTLSEGDMVSVKVMPRAPQQMYWNTGLSVPPRTRPEVQYFSYREKLDYIPIFIEFDPEDMPQEVGLYLGGDCRGAAVVDSSLIEVNFYGADENQQKGDDEIRIVFYYEGKGHKKAPAASIYNPQTLLFESGSLSIGDLDDYAYVSFRREAGASLTPLVLELKQNYPNPFMNQTQISWVLDKEAEVNLDVFNLRGQKVKTLYRGLGQKGKQHLFWDVTDDNGSRVSSGVYFYRLSTPQRSIVQKMLLIK